MNGLQPSVHLLGPVVPGDALADEPALEIGEGHEHRVDRAVRDLFLELGRGEHSRNGGHRRMLRDSYECYSGVT